MQGDQTGGSAVFLLRNNGSVYPGDNIGDGDGGGWNLNIF